MKINKELGQGDNMEKFILFIVIVVFFLICLVVFKKKRKNGFVNDEEIKFADNNKHLVMNDSLEELQIKFEMIPITLQVDENSLVEIKDTKILQRINNLGAGSFIAGTAAWNAVQSNAQVLYQAIIPAGMELSKSKDMTGAVRGMYHGTKGVKGHANLIQVNSKGKIAMNVTASIMSVGSIIVGQYYMEQINAELTRISEKVSSIADFQNNEFKSKVFALITQIKKLTSFQVETLANEELRVDEIGNLNSWEQQCIELLGQANLTIAGFSKKINLGFDEYEKELTEAHNWYIYQKTLLEVLYRIADLKHTLYLGSISREQSDALLSIYSQQVKDTISQLNIWHQSQAENLGINRNKYIRRRAGVDGLIHKLPSLINGNYKFRPISEKTANTITIQTTDYEISCKMGTVDLFQKDVRVISKEGKLYYLPESDTSL